MKMSLLGMPERTGKAGSTSCGSCAKRCLSHQGQTSQGSQWAAALFEDKFCGFHVHPLGETSQAVLYHVKHHVAHVFWRRTHAFRYRFPSPIGKNCFRRLRLEPEVWRVSWSRKRYRSAVSLSTPRPAPAEAVQDDIDANRCRRRALPLPSRRIPARPHPPAPGAKDELCPRELPSERAGPRSR